MNFDPHDISAIFEVFADWIYAYGILIARPTAMLTISPVFMRAEFSNLARGAVVNALILPLWGRFTPIYQAHRPDLFHGVLLALKELLIGGALGLPLSLPFYALMVAGDIMDQQRGQSQNRLSNPGGGDDVSVTGTLFLMSAIAVYMLSGGLESMTEALYQSWDVWRPLEMLPMPDARAPVLALELLDAVFRRGLELALPAVVAMLLSDTAMLIIARIAPQLHLDDVMSAARNLVFVIFIPVYASYLIYYDARDQRASNNVLGLILPVLAPSEHGIMPPPIPAGH